jgi:hypothetical protein
MSLFGRAVVKAKIIPAGSLQARVAQYLFDVADGATVEKQLRGCRVSE